METQPLHTKRKDNDSKHTGIITAQILGTIYAHTKKHKQEPVDADIQALIWNKEIKFDADEDGTEKVNRRFMKKGAEYNSTQELGLGLLHWPSLSEALL